MKAKPKYQRELGVMTKNWKMHKSGDRMRWAEEGQKELARRVSKRLSITQKDAKNILRIVGQEGADMAIEGWVFSIPFLGIFYTVITAIKKCSLPGYVGQMLGGNKQMKSVQSGHIKKRFKEEKLNEVTVKSETV